MNGSNISNKTAVEPIVVHAGEVYERVYLNAPSLDLHFVQEEGSTLRLHILNLYSALSESVQKQLADGIEEKIEFAPAAPVVNTISVEQVGKQCKTELYGLAFLNGQEQVSTSTHVHHTIGEGESQQLIKFVLDGESKGEFFGELKIAPDAQKTSAHQTSRNLLLSRTATMRTRPQLEIYADDVKATHGASTGQLDESALFYMQQRCLSEQTARQLLVGAFMKDIVETIPDMALREKLVEAIDGVVE